MECTLKTQENLVLATWIQNLWLEMINIVKTSKPLMFIYIIRTIILIKYPIIIVKGSVLPFSQNHACKRWLYISNHSSCDMHFRFTCEDNVFLYHFFIIHKLKLKTIITWLYLNLLILMFRLEAVEIRIRLKIDKYQVCTQKKKKSLLKS